MADLKTTNIFGDAYINNKVGIATNAPATRLQIGQLSPTAATEGIQFGDDTNARLYRDTSARIVASSAFRSGDYITAGTYFQTSGNLIYPSGQSATQRLQVGNAANNAWMDGLTIAPGGHVTTGGYLYAGTYLQAGNSNIYTANQSTNLLLNVGNSANNAWINGISIAPGGNVTVFNDLTVNGNTYLGNANGDTVYVNDTIRIGATDSGDASLFFGEGTVAGSDYGARWYWDSLYTFTWYTRNNGTDTALFDYVTNDLNYINWRRHFHMQNKEINYNAQVHFNAGTRFVGEGTNYLIFRSDATNAGGIKVQDGSATTKGYTGYWDSAGGGILNNTGNWAVRYNFGNANSGGQLYGDWSAANFTATTFTGTLNGNANAVSFTEVELNAPVTVSGTWTTGNGSEWGEPKFGTSFNQFRYTDGNGPYVEYNIPANHHACFISQLQWDTGGYADCHGVQSDGDLVFLRRINTRQLVENSNHGNPIQHDGATVTFVGSGLQAFSKIRITNRSGRIHMTGIAFTRQIDDGYEGTGMVHPAQISHQGAGSGLDADLLDGYGSATANTANTIVLRDGSGNFSAGTITATLSGNATTATSADNIDGRPFVNTNSNSATNADTINSNGISYYTSGVTNFSGNATDGALFSQAYSDAWQHQIAGDYRSGQIALRGKNNGTWQSWRRVLDETNSPYALNMNQYVRTTDSPTFANSSVTGITMTNLTGAYQNTTVYDSAKTQSATPSRGIRAPASSIQFTDSYAIAPFYTYRSTGDWPVPYGIGWGTGGESSGIFQRYASNGSSFGDMIFYTGNDGSGAFSFRRHTWEGTAHFAAGSGELSTELFRVDWAGNVSIIGGFTISHPGSGYAQFSNWVKLGTSGFFSDTNSAHIYPNNASYGSWRMDGTRNGWGGIEFGNNGVSLMMGSDTVGFHQNTNGWLFRVHNGSGFIYKGSWGGGTAATILDSSNQAYAWAMNQNVTTTSSPTFSELTLSGTGIGAYGFVKYGGIRNGNWQTFTDSAGEMNIIQTNNITDGNHSNYPTGVYGYGAVLSWRTSNHSFQLYAAHTGDLAYKTQWDNDNYSGWRRILDSTNYVHAANMNQYVRTTDNPTFGTVTAALSGNATTATTLQTARAINGVSFNGSAAITVNGLNYNVNNEWLRENGDDAHFQMYGNSRTMIYRTDGNTNTHGGGAYAHIFYYGGSADANRMFIINTDGRLWSNYHGWLDTMSTTGNAATATSAGCVNSDTGNVGGSRLQYWQTSGNTALNPDGEWYNAIRMGHGDPVTYYSNTLAVRMTGGNLGDIYTRTTTNGATGSWNRFWHNNNDGAGSGLDADLVDGKGLAIAGTADTIVLRDSSGHITGQYILGSYFNASAGNNENPTIGQIWTQNTTDNYLRKSTPAHFRSQVTDGSYPSLTGANASGTWSISVTGNAATATLATKASTLSQGGGNGTGMTFNWSGQSGQPTWLWGSNDGTNIYVWNPSNFNVNSATTATTANALNTGNSYTITGLTSNGTISIFPSYVSPYSSFLRMGYDNSGNYEYTIKRDGTTGFLEFYNTQANYTGYYFRVNGSGGGLGIAVSPASRLHVNGDGTNPAVRVDNTGVVLAASVGSNGRQFYGWLPISVDGTTRWIRIFS